MDKNRLKKEIARVLEQYQDLVLDASGKLYRVFGSLDILYVDGRVIDTFSIEMVYPDRYPFCYPEVKETGGRIPAIADRHVYTDTKTLCLGTPEEETLKCINGISTRWFMEKILIPRLADEHRVCNGYAYTHEYAHRAEGRWKFFMEKFRTKKTDDVLMWLKKIYWKRLPEGKEQCLCGSHLPFKRCHENIVNEVKKVGRDTVARWYLYLTKNSYTSTS